MRASRVQMMLAVAVTTASLGADVARADGLPVLGVDVGATGVVTPAGQARYVTIPAGTNTVVARVSRNGGRILASMVLPGIFTIPAVAYDGSAGGLSGDGRTLVLIEPRASFPRAQTALVVIDTPRLAVRRVMTLHGDFSFDAVSPRGSLIYLIQYTSASDPNKYNVRAYDSGTRRLLAAPIVDPRQPAEKMQGRPLTRVASPDGRWAYTLYDGAGKKPFVHALDTSRRTARCIDLDELAGTDLTRLRLRLDPLHDLLSITHGSEPALDVDLRSLAVTAASSGRSGFPWAVPVLATIAALVAAGLSPWARRRLRGNATPAPSP